MPFDFSGCDLWDRLALEKRDILLWGMGNGADKILAVLAAKNIPAAGIFASDGFVRGQAFHGFSVRSFSEVMASYPPNGCVVLLAFGSARPEVLDNARRLAARYPLFIPDVPVCGDTLFDSTFFTAHRSEFRNAHALLADEPSRILFDDILAYKLTGDPRHLAAATSPAEAPWRYLTPQTLRRAADIGAYTGDTARELLCRAPLEFLLCVEPDARSFKKLRTWGESVTDCTVECHAVAVSDRCGTATFAARGNRGAGLGVGQKTVSVVTATPDALLAGRAVDYIKYDVEGAEAAALTGSRHTLTAYSPCLRIACYHRSEDLYALPLLLHDLAPRYRSFLTRGAGFPAWDIDLIALPS